jgi:hypothetical protein
MAEYACKRRNAGHVSACTPSCKATLRLMSICDGADRQPIRDVCGLMLPQDDFAPYQQKACCSPICRSTLCTSCRCRGQGALRRSWCAEQSLGYSPAGVPGIINVVGEGFAQRLVRRVVGTAAAFLVRA